MTVFRKTRSGDKGSKSPVNSSSWLNAVSESAEYFQSNIAGGQSQQKLRQLVTQPTMVKTKNVAGEPLKRGHLVQLGNPLLPPGERRPWFDGSKTADPIDDKIAIVQQPIAVDRIGFAQMLGVTVALVNVTDIAHTHATPVDDALVMDSSESGPARILSALSVTGEQEVAAFIGSTGGGSVSIRFARAAETIVGLLNAADQPSLDPIPPSEPAYPDSDASVDYPVIGKPLRIGEGAFVLYESVEPQDVEDPLPDPVPSWFPPTAWPDRVWETMQIQTAGDLAVPPLYPGAEIGEGKEHPRFIQNPEWTGPGDPDPTGNVQWIPNEAKHEKQTFQLWLPGCILKNAPCFIVNGRALAVSPHTIRPFPTKQTP